MMYSPSFRQIEFLLMLSSAKCSLLPVKEPKILLSSITHFLGIIIEMSLS